MDSEVRTERPPEVIRRRLLDEVDDTTAWVVLISAGAGMGKTTLVRQLCARREAAGAVCAPVSFEGDASGVDLVTALLDALESDGRTMDDVVDVLWGRAPEMIDVVVDDAHRLDRDGVRTLALLAQELPRNARLVVTSRASLADVAAALVPDRVPVVIREPALLFDDAELGQLVGDRPIEPTPALRWPARATLTIAVGADVADEYLWAEILRWIGPDERRALATAAHLGTLDAELLRQCCPSVDDVRSLLDQTPLVDQEQPGRWRVHRLWREALDGELDDTTLADITRTAADYERGRGNLEAAAGRLIDAGLWVDLLRLAVDLAADYSYELNVARFARWTARLPADLADLPEARLVRAMLSMPTEPERSFIELAAVRAELEASGWLRGEVAALTQMTRIAVWQQSADMMAPLVARVDAIAAHEDDDPAIRELHQLHRALVAFVSGSLDEVLDLYDERDMASATTFEPVLRWMRGFALLDVGEPEAALREAELALASNTNPDFELPLRDVHIESVFAVRGASDAVGLLSEVWPTVEATGLDQFIGAAAVRLVAGQAFLDRVGDARRTRARHGDAIDRLDGGHYPVLRAMADALIAVADGDDELARSMLGDVAARHPIDGPATRGGWMRHAALTEALLPGRTAALPTTAFVTRAQRLAAAMQARWKGHGDPTAALDPADLDAAASHLPYRWIAELAVSAPRPVAERLLGTLGADAAQLLRTVAPQDDKTLRLIPRTPAAGIEIRLLGPLEIRRDGLAIDDARLRRARVRELVALLVHADGPMEREIVGARMWPDKTRAAAAQNLRVNLSHLLGALEPDRPKGGASFFVRQVGSTLALASDLVTVDIHEFDAALRRAEASDRAHDTRAALDSHLDALVWWRGAPDAFDDVVWAPEEAGRLRGAFVRAAVRAADLLTAVGRADEAVEWAERAMEADPWSLEPIRAAIAASAAAGHAAAHLVDRGRRIAHELDAPLPAWADI